MTQMADSDASFPSLSGGLYAFFLMSMARWQRFSPSPMLYSFQKMSSQNCNGSHRYAMAHWRWFLADLSNNWMRWRRLCGHRQQACMVLNGAMRQANCIG